MFQGLLRLAAALFVTRVWIVLSVVHVTPPWFSSKLRGSTLLPIETWTVEASCRGATFIAGEKMLTTSGSTCTTAALHAGGPHWMLLEKLLFGLWYYDAMAWNVENICTLGWEKCRTKWKEELGKVGNMPVPQVSHPFQPLQIARVLANHSKSLSVSIMEHLVPAVSTCLHRRDTKTRRLRGLITTLVLDSGGECLGIVET